MTNGLGGYSSCSMAGVITRRYHGLLVAALPNPLGRMVMLNHLGECVSANGSRCRSTARSAWPAGSIGAGGARRERPARSGPSGVGVRVEGVRIEKRILMPHRQNTVHVTYRLLGGPSTARLELCRRSISAAMRIL